MKQKQQETIWMVEYFCPSNFNGWSSIDHPKENDLDGKDPIEAFFDFTSRGIKPEKCTDWAKYNKLVVGLQWMTTHEKMYREGFEDGSFSIIDFEGKPEYFKKWITKIWNNVVYSYDPFKDKQLKVLHIFRAYSSMVERLLCKH